MPKERNSRQGVHNIVHYYHYSTFILSKTNGNFPLSCLSQWEIPRGLLNAMANSSLFNSTDFTD